MGQRRLNRKGKKEETEGKQMSKKIFVQKAKREGEKHGESSGLMEKEIPQHHQNPYT